MFSIQENLAWAYSSIFTHQNLVSRQGFQSALSRTAEKIADVMNALFVKEGQRKIPPFHATLLVATMVTTLVIFTVYLRVQIKKYNSPEYLAALDAELKRETAINFKESFIKKGQPKTDEEIEEMVNKLF